MEEEEDYYAYVCIHIIYTAWHCHDGLFIFKLEIGEMCTTLMNFFAIKNFYSHNSYFIQIAFIRKKFALIRLRKYYCKLVILVSSSVDAESVSMV